MKVFLILTLAVTSLIGADATGKWHGTLTPTGEEAGTAHLVLKQDGATLTGTAGSRAEAQKPIQNGKVENGNITFELTPAPGAIMKFTLKLDGDEIKGDVRGERASDVITAKLVVKREH